jgi:hypothetical protein
MLDLLRNELTIAGVNGLGCCRLFQIFVIPAQAGIQPVASRQSQVSGHTCRG